MLPSDKDTLEEGDGSASRDEKLVGQPFLFLLLRCEEPLAASVRYRLAGLETVAIGRGARGDTPAAMEVGPDVQLAFPEKWMSSEHARLSRTDRGWVIEDQGSRNGTQVNGLRVTRQVLKDGDLLELGHTFWLFRDSLANWGDEPASFEGAELAPAARLGLATLIPSLARDFAALREIARSAVSVVVRGETGTGKELIAQALHALSARRGPFIPVNCGGLAPSLVHSELFGYRKGAFSGATEDRPGLIRSADRGTLFLDEIGDLAAESQVAILRALQEKEVMPVGGTRAVGVDVRVCAASHRSLEDLVHKGEFRQDLWARLCGFTIHLPPLRRRREDLGLLIATILRRRAPERASGTTFTLKAARALLSHEWPGNIRQLEKCLETALVLACSKPIDLKHLANIVRRVPEPEGSEGVPHPSLKTEHREELAELLSRHQGNVAEVARALGKARFQIRRWLKRYQLDPKTFRRSKPLQ